MRRIRDAVLLISVLLVCAALLVGCESAEQIASDARIRAEAANAELERAQSSAGIREVAAEEEPASGGRVTTLSSARSGKAAASSAAPASEPLSRKQSSAPSQTAARPETLAGASPSPETAPAPAVAAPSETSQGDPALSADPEGSASSQAPPQEPASAETPPELPASAADFEILKEGSEGESVADLQERLAGLGYLTQTPTGFFGRQTKAAVEDFQRANSLVDDGVVGNSTWVVLLSPHSIPARGA